ncbi:carboxypeptidase-like regulatory domain-containing protein [Gaetbulibacter aestuarii]|uniref:Carboxypeptidase-like regulatory domain-containing protein n=1 Tax=Gaetbulibacter aestuarii TaxID=1502358 RepID=A0ABW7N1V9_9FLAO
MKYLYGLAFLFMGIFSSQSQNITTQLIDKGTGKPIPYATIKTGTYSGVISNEDGYFTLNLNDNQISEISISCLGYQTLTLTKADFRTSKGIIKLEENINQLDEVYVTNKYPGVESIIAKVKANISSNYSNELHKYNVFHRNSESVDFKNLDFEIEKASHISKKNIAAANADFNNFSNKIRESDMVYFTDFKGEFYNFNKDSSKLSVSKATKLIDYKNDFSIDEIQEKAQNIMLTYLDTTKTYKLKTGIFKIEDSLSLKSDDLKEDNPNELSVKQLNNSTQDLLKRGLFYNESFLSAILNPEDYEYHLDDVSTINNQLSYVISFEPNRHRAKFEGKMVVNADDYAMTRLQYTYFKNRHGSKLNLKFLLGVKYEEDLNDGLILFEKNANNTYFPKYVQRKTGSYFYVNRSLKFIENSSERNKIGFEFKIEGHNTSKDELLIIADSKLNLDEFKALKPEDKIKVDVLSKYDKTLWENEVSIEPSKEMKAFEAKN